jgi:AhpD family alkylhydroperoxidase
MAAKSTKQTDPATLSAAGRPARKGRAAAMLRIVAGGAKARQQGAAGEPADGPAKQHRKPKRTLTPENLFRSVANVVASFPTLVTGLVNPKTSAALREKVVLGVTSVNDCRYCKWGHTHWAMAHGVPLEEVNQILRHQIDELEAKDPAEAAAILFAQHYAEQQDHYDPESIESLRQHYNDAQVAEILAYVRAITLGNLTGNTVDAFVGRFRRHGHTGIFFEGAVAALAAPVLIALTIAAAFDRQVGMDAIDSRHGRD